MATKSTDKPGSVNKQGAATPFARSVARKGLGPVGKYRWPLHPADIPTIHQSNSLPALHVQQML